MPLINSVIKTVFKQQLNDHILIEELDGTQYRFDPGPDHTYIEGETLDIRVDGMNKNLELEGIDELQGQVTDSFLDPSQLIDAPLMLEELDDWVPATKYGEAASEHFFPIHHGKSYKAYRLVYPGASTQEDLEIRNIAEQYFQQKKFAESTLELSKIMHKYPWMLDLYYIMGNLYLALQQPARARKYFELGLRIAGLSLPEKRSEMIMSARYYENSAFLSLLQGLAGAHEIDKDEEGMKSCLRQAYELDPFDYLGHRLVLQRVTDEKFPDPNTSTGDYRIDPYMAFSKFNIPIPDHYDPDTKTDAKNWNLWEDSYKRILVFMSHEPIFSNQKVKAEEMAEHVSMHVLTENAIAADYPKGTRLHLARLMADGAKRHQALHQIGQGFMDSMKQAHLQQETIRKKMEAELADKTE